MWRTICICIAACASCQADPGDKVTLKKYAGKTGDRIRVTQNIETVTTSNLDVFGVIKSRVEKSSDAETTLTEILAEGKENDRPLELKRTYEKATRTEFGKTTSAKIEGKTVLITRKDNTYTFAHEDGGTVDRGIVARLAGEFNRTPGIDDFVMFFPEDAVATGANWDIKKSFINGFEKPFLFQHEKTTGQAKLVSTAMKDGKRHGVVESKAVSPLAGIDGFPPGVIKPGSTMAWEWKGEGVVDGSSPNCETIHTFSARTIMEGAESLQESKTTRKVELLPRK